MVARRSNYSRVAARPTSVPLASCMVFEGDVASSTIPMSADPKLSSLASLVEEQLVTEPVLRVVNAQESQ